MARAYRSSQLVYAAAALGIADLLAGGAKTCGELAAALSASPDAVCRVMRGLMVLGVFDQLADGRYELNELSEPLLSAGDSSVRLGLIHLANEEYRAWGDLLQTIKTGEPAFNRMFGERYAYYDRNSDAAGTFDDWMAMSSRQMADTIAQTYEFPDTGTVVDVGGGVGVLLAAVLKPRPALRGILLERGTVIDKARKTLEAEGVQSRCELIDGDFRKAVPPGGDVYVLKNVLHDWRDAIALEILGACRRAMGRDARLVVIQRAMPSDGRNETYLRSLVESDLMQMISTGGRERTDKEFQHLLGAAGLRVSLTMQSDGATWLIEARPQPP